MTQQETAAAVTATSSRKEVRKEIAAKLTGALSDYKQEIGEKKLAIHVKKVSKLIVRDLEKSGKKKDEAKPKVKKVKKVKVKAKAKVKKTKDVRKGTLKSADKKKKAVKK